MSRPVPSPPTQPDPLLAASALDFLLIELVPLAQRIAEQHATRDRAQREDYARSQIFHDQPVQTPSAAAAASKPTVDTLSVGGAPTDNTTAAGGAGDVEEENRDAVFWRLDGMGYRVGQGLVERFSAGRPRPQTPLDSIKFVCKDLWPLLFRKQIDNLKTNHRGVFVLTDQRFQPISRVSVDRKAGVKAGEETLSRAQAYLYFPCGIIRGALAGLGMDVTVHADSSEIPAATFQIKTRGAKA